MMSSDFVVWLGISPAVIGRNVSFLKPILPSPWRIRLSADDLLMWWKRSGIDTIFFDGTSKGNLGISSVDGMVFFPDC